MFRNHNLPYGLDGAFELGQRLDELKRLVRRTALGPTTKALVDEAQRRGIPVMRLDEKSLIQLGHGKYQQRLRASITGRTSLVAADLAGDKHMAEQGRGIAWLRKRGGGAAA